MHRRMDTLQCPYCHVDVEYVYPSDSWKGADEQEWVCENPAVARDGLRPGIPSGCGKTFLAWYDPDADEFVSAKMTVDRYDLSEAMIRGLKDPEGCRKDTKEALQRRGLVGSDGLTAEGQDVLDILGES